MDIQGKVALVTGASSGIGEGVARKLAAAGVKVGLAARRIDTLNKIVDEITAAGGQATAIEMDVTDTAAVEAGVQSLVATYGSLDILLNNSGLMPLSDIDSLKTDEWRRMIDVNIQGVLNVTAAVLPTMIAQKNGHIFFTSSIAGRKVFKGLSVYCATKHAVSAFAEGLRMEIAPKHNIRVTSLQPGAVATELYDHITDKDYRQQMDDLAGSMVFLQPEDIAETLLFALKAPDHVDIADMFIMPTQQGW
ncbi:SDR family oxidoreductase [Caulobacter sp. CCNWLY153]|uniref:Oxidoreductase n=1 Tax=Caulobacter radicis TaxID=2172650 RepID=A0A2T9JM88_9CAUL|nr:SDR family oxidoreductase [Caulobacter radicis]PVM84786.1 oxidoreductase [Caulobacter radicis]